MHVLVKDAEHHEVVETAWGGCAGDGLDDGVANLGHIRECFLAAGQGQLPARVMFDLYGIPEPVGILSYRAVPASVSQGPAFLEPCHVADLPKKRVYYVEAGTDELSVVEVGNQFEAVLARVEHTVGQFVPFHGAGV